MDASERSQLVRDKMNLAAFLAACCRRRYARARAVDFDDLLQAGYLGLCEAAIRYDEKRGVEFGVYARHWVNFCIREEIRCHPAITMPARAIRAGQSWLHFDDMPDDMTAKEDHAAATRRADTAEWLAARVAELGPREQIILTLRYGLGGNEAIGPAEIGCRMGFSRQIVERHRSRGCAALALTLERE